MNQDASLTEFINTLLELYPDIMIDAVKRVVRSDRVFDSKTHKLRDDMSEDRARAVLVLARHCARQLGFSVAYSSDEKKLMATQFDEKN